MWGKGEGTLLEKGSPPPSSSKTFVFIESLFPAFPVDKKKSLNAEFRLFFLEGCVKAYGCFILLYYRKWLMLFP